MALHGTRYHPKVLLERELGWYPREDSNLHTRFRKPVLYPAELRGHLAQEDSVLQERRLSTHFHYTQHYMEKVLLQLDYLTGPAAGEIQRLQKYIAANTRGKIGTVGGGAGSIGRDEYTKRSAVVQTEQGSGAR